MKIEGRFLATSRGFYALVASVIFTFVTTRPLPTEELAVLTVFNSGYAVDPSILEYVTTWYLRVLAG